jgi:hypothetical protein
MLAGAASTEAAASQLMEQQICLVDMPVQALSFLGKGADAIPQLGRHNIDEPLTSSF